MSNHGRTVEQINRDHFANAVGSAERAKRDAERLESMGNSLEQAFSKKYDLNELVKIGNQFEDGSLDPVQYGVDRCMAFSGHCELALKDLEKQKGHLSTTAGYAYMQNKLDIYKDTVQQKEVIESQIDLLRKFT